MSERVLALIHYYAREGLHRQVQNVANEVLKQRANDSTLVFWRAACGILPEGNTSEVRTGTRADLNPPHVTADQSPLSHGSMIGCMPVCQKPQGWSPCWSCRPCGI